MDITSLSEDSFCFVSGVVVNAETPAEVKNGDTLQKLRLRITTIEKLVELNQIQQSRFDHAGG